LSDITNKKNVRSRQILYKYTTHVETGDSHASTFKTETTNELV